MEYLEVKYVGVEYLGVIYIHCLLYSQSYLNTTDAQRPY